MLCFNLHVGRNAGLEEAYSEMSGLGSEQNQTIVSCLVRETALSPGLPGNCFLYDGQHPHQCWSAGADWGSCSLGVTQVHSPALHHACDLDTSMAYTSPEQRIFS